MALSARKIKQNNFVLSLRALESRQALTGAVFPIPSLLAKWEAALLQHPGFLLCPDRNSSCSQRNPRRTPN